MNIPEGFRAIEGSHRKPEPDAIALGPAPPDEVLSATIVLRPRAPLPELSDWQSRIQGTRQHLSVEEFAERYGAAPGDVAKVTAFAASHGLTVTDTNIARRTVTIRGTVAQMSSAFRVTLTHYDAPRRRARRKLGSRPEPERYTYRGRDGAVHLPHELIPLVIAVIGLDNRKLGGINIGDPPGTSTLTVPEIVKLYNFPTNSASGQTIGIFNGGGNYDTTPMTGDIAKYFAGMPAGFNTIPDIQDVPSGSNDPSLTGTANADFEITQDILIAATVAQGAKIAVYFEADDEAGWTDWANKAAMPATGEPTPSVLTSSWIFSHSDDTDSVPADVQTALSMAFQAAAVRGVTIFVAQGDTGSSDGLGTDGLGRSCHVQYAGTDPWVTSCGGTTVGNVAPDQSSFDEVSWSDVAFGSNVATGGGVSDAIAQPDFQLAAGVSPVSLNPGGGVRRGVPDIAGNASPNSGYPCTVGGAAFTANGTSAVAPLYAGLVAVINAALGQQAGYLNPTLYALGSQLGIDIGIYPFRDITSGDNSAADGAPFYSAGSGWDACTGWGSINGALLLDAFRILTTKRCQFLVDRDHFGQDEVDGIRASTGKGIVTGAFQILVDGFTPTELGITGVTSASEAPAVTFSPAGGITNPAKCTSLTSDDPNFGPEVQRFRFGYDVDFGADDTAFGFSGDSAIVTISTTYKSLPTITAQLTLLKQPDPFIKQGPDTWWLSNDIRLIQVATGDTAFGVTMGTDPFAFLSAVTSALEAGQGNAGGQAFDANTGEDSEVISVAPFTIHGTSIVNVFNFAIARVHYQGFMSQATDVRVFFRLFAANSTTTDFSSGTTYRRFAAYSPNYPVPPANYNQNVLPTMGVAGGEYVSLPCFGEARQNAAQSGAANTMPSLQTPDAFNVRTLQPTGAGSAHDTFYGCFLDINTSVPALPLVPPGGNIDGPWPSSTGVALESLQTAFIINDHQCLLAEIAFDPDPIAEGTQPFNSDKFAQRNISWSAVANPGVPSSRTALEPFEVRPTPGSVGDQDMPDEIMIDWNNVPKGQTAEIYLPGVDASAVLAKALQLYGTQRLKIVDAHTVSCATGGATYIPLSKGSADGANFVGLLSVFMPYGIQKGELYTCVVRQVTNAFGKRVSPPPQINAAAVAGVATHQTTDELTWRRVLGTFQVNIPVSTKEALLPREVQKLSIFKAIAEKMPTSRRWYPVFQRYLSGIGGRVAGFGGDPDKVGPSHTGLGQPDGPGGTPLPAHAPGHGHEPGEHVHEHREYTGKISGLLFDGFGDFEGFLLETLERSHVFWSREQEIRTLVERAWRERLRITVEVKAHEPCRPLRIIFREPPAPF